MKFVLFLISDMISGVFSEQCSQKPPNFNPLTEDIDVECYCDYFIDTWPNQLGSSYLLVREDMCDFLQIGTNPDSILFNNCLICTQVQYCRHKQIYYEASSISAKLVSGTLMTIVGLFLVFHKKLQGDIYGILGFTSLMEAMVLFQETNIIYQCFKPTQNIMYYTILWPFNSPLTQKWIFDYQILVIAINKWILLVAVGAYQMLNGMLAIELLLIFKNPFFPRQKRIRILYLGFNIIMIAWAIHQFMNVYGHYYTEEEVQDKSEDITHMSIYITLSISFMTIGLQISAIYKLFKNGTTPKLRQLIMYRHILYTFFYCLFLVHEYSLIYMLLQTGDINYSIPLYYVPEAISSLVGIFMAYLRIREPYVWYTFKNEFCIKKEKNTSKFETESLNAFINSATNIEYVYLIIVGINKFQGLSEEDPNISRIHSSGLQIQDSKNWSLNRELDQIKSIDLRSLSQLDENQKDEVDLKMKIKSEIICHAEMKFKELLEIDNITTEDLNKSLDIINNRDRVFQAGEGAGQSGSFFFFSFDNRFIIKTLRGNEKQVLLDMLDDLIAHVKSTDNKTLLAKIYGLYTIKTNRFNDLDIIIMQNTTFQQNESNERLVFDLKGSTYKRQTMLAQGERQFWLRGLNSKRILKDNNFVQINKDIGHGLINLGLDQVKEINQSIRKDAEFLAEHNLMDYSLLLVIEQQNTDCESQQDVHRIRFQSSQECDFSQMQEQQIEYSQQKYYFGIIDYLQDYNISKKTERLWYMCSKPKKVHSTISCVPPNKYAKRFVNFIEQNVIKYRQGDQNNQDNFRENFMNKMKIY